MPTVFGFGSLLSEASARETVPSLENYRHVRVDGWKRVFSKVAMIFIWKYGASPDQRDIASCATRPDPAVSIMVACFDCPDEDFWPLYEREHRYRWVEVTGEDEHGEAVTGRMCTEWTDEDYRLNRCVTDAEYRERVGQYYDGPIWRDDILPFPTYLAHCLDAVERAGPDVLDNFLDTSFLADGITPLRRYLAQNPGWREGIEDYSYARRG